MRRPEKGFLDHVGNFFYPFKKVSIFVKNNESGKLKMQEV